MHAAVESTHPALTFPAIRALIHADMDAVDALIRRRLASDVALVHQIAEYIVGAGGKRLRPMLCVLAARAAGYQGQAHHQLAAVIEFIHTATLLHDDVVDGSDLRRGRTTANALFGNAASVLVGDFLYSRAFQLMVELDSMTIQAVLADTTNRIAEGEVLQLLHIRNPDVDEAAYLAVIERKTAVLFAAATRLGGHLAGIDGPAEQALHDYGLALGLAFQITDDLLDYCGEASVLGKNPGDDLAEGKLTLPLIHALAHSPVATRATLRRIVEQGDAEGLPVVLAAIHHCGSLEHGRNLARHHADRACAALHGRLAEGVHRHALEALAGYALNRDH